MTIRRRYSPVTRQVAGFFSWDALDGFTRAAVPVTVDGVEGTFTRAASDTGTDTDGTTYTVPNNFPAYYHASSTFRGVLASTDLNWSLPASFAPASTTITGTVTYIGKVRIRWVYGAAGFVEIICTSTTASIQHHNGTSGDTESVSLSLSADDIVDITATVGSDGKVQASFSKNGAAVVTTPLSSAITPQAVAAAAVVEFADTGDADADYALRSFAIAPT